MSFSTIETSDQLGKPVLLFEFQRDGVTWRYAAAADDVVLGAATYYAETVSCDEIVQSGDSTQDEFKIVAPITLPVVQAYLNNNPTGTLSVRVRRHHIGDDDSALVWVGTLDRVRATGDASADMICSSALASIETGALRLAWTRTCTHMLFDSECRAVKDTFKRIATVSAISGSTVTAAGLAGDPAGVLRGGYLEWTTAEGYVERQTILADANGAVTLMGPAIGLTVGMAVAGYYGCPHTAEACSSIFSNLDNFGGFIHLPQKSPFDGNPVF